MNRVIVSSQLKCLNTTCATSATLPVHLPAALDLDGSSTLCLGHKHLSRDVTVVVPSLLNLAETFSVLVAFTLFSILFVERFKLLLLFLPKGWPTKHHDPLLWGDIWVKYVNGPSH
jgi:hypothetical protein